MDHLLGTVRWVSDIWEIFAATSITIMDQIFLSTSKNSNFSSAHVSLPTPYILMDTLWLSLTTLLNNGEWFFNLWLCLSTSEWCFITGISDHSNYDRPFKKIASLYKPTIRISYLLAKWHLIPSFNLFIHFISFST